MMTVVVLVIVVVSCRDVNGAGRCDSSGRHVGSVGCDCGGSDGEVVVVVVVLM